MLLPGCKACCSVELCPDSSQVDPRAEGAQAGSGPALGKATLSLSTLESVPTPCVSISRSTPKSPLTPSHARHCSKPQINKITPFLKAMITFS